MCVLYWRIFLYCFVSCFTQTWLNTGDFTELAHCDVQPFWSMNSLWNFDDRGISLLNIAMSCGNE
jgi:hypothetical protein